MSVENKTRRFMSKMCRHKQKPSHLIGQTAITWPLYAVSENRGNDHFYKSAGVSWENGTTLECLRSGWRTRTYMMGELSLSKILFHVENVRFPVYWILCYVVATSSQVHVNWWRIRFAARLQCLKNDRISLLGTRFEVRNCICEPCLQEPYRDIFNTCIDVLKGIWRKSSRADWDVTYCNTA
jgi:hypothetical protein